MIKYDPSKHKYTYKGQLVPSVTQIIGTINKGMYDGIPKAILERKASYGDRVHELVENYALTGEIPDGFNFKSFEGIALKRYMKLQEQYEIKIASCEQMVWYLEDDCAVYAGIYDMLGTVKGETAIIDIKTTAKLHTLALELQLPMYKYAIEQRCKELGIKKAYCLWLPKKGLGRLVEIKLPDSKDEIMPRIKEASVEYALAHEEV